MPQRRIRTAPTSAWSMPSSRRSRRRRSSGASLAAASLELLAVELAEHEPADVVKEGGGRQLVALVQAGDLGDAVGGVADRDARGGGSARGARPGARAARAGRRSPSGGERARRRSTLSASIASGTPATRPGGPLPLFAACITAIASAASDSTASATSPVEEPGARGADQPAASLGQRRQRATASNASASRRPPAPARRARPFPFVALDSLIVPMSSSRRAGAAPRAHPSIGSRAPHGLAAGAPIAQASAQARPERGSTRSVRSRPSAASESKIPGRDRGPGDRDPERLVERRSALTPSRSTSASSAPRAPRLERLGRAQDLERRASAGSPRRLHQLRPGLLVVDRRLEQEADQRPDLVERLRLVLGDRARGAQRARGRRRLARGPRLRGRAATASAYSSSGSSRM